MFKLVGILSGLNSLQNGRWGRLLLVRGGRKLGVLLGAILSRPYSVLFIIGARLIRHPKIHVET